MLATRAIDFLKLFDGCRLPEGVHVAILVPVTEYHDALHVKGAAEAIGLSAEIFDTTDVNPETQGREASYDVAVGRYWGFDSA